MTPEFYLIAALIIVALAIGFWWFKQQLKTLQEGLKPDDNLLKVIDSLQKLSPSLTGAMQQSTKTLSERLDNAAKYISQVAKEVGQMNELGQSMRDLQVFLQSPKLRGNIGEQVLKDLIAQSFPRGSFHLQYGFKSGDKVDAVIKPSAGLLPIDSKFPLENFRKMTTAETKLERNA